jgi:NAD(P)-dependent dehydrogenase (short-subunit alcohol dehydrogenase family)
VNNGVAVITGAARGSAEATPKRWLTRATASSPLTGAATSPQSQSLATPENLYETSKLVTPCGRRVLAAVADIRSLAAMSGDLFPVPFVEPIDDTNVVTFLAADKARYITGVTLPVDADYAVT